MTPKISCVTPSNSSRKKRKEFLLDAGKSLQAQTYKNLEWIIVSGEPLNPDTEKELRENLKTLDYKIVIADDDHKISRARNIGIEHSTGEYIAFLDDDDIKYPTWCEEMLKATVDLKPPYIASMCDMDVINTDGRIFSQHIVRDTDFNSFWTNGTFYYVNELLISKPMLDKVGWFDDKMQTSEDYEFAARIFKNGKVNMVRKKLCAYRKHNENISDFCGGEPTHKSIHYYHEKHGIKFNCKRCGKIEIPIPIRRVRIPQPRPQPFKKVVARILLTPEQTRRIAKAIPQPKKTLLIHSDISSIMTPHKRNLP